MVISGRVIRSVPGVPNISPYDVEASISMLDALQYWYMRFRFRSVAVYLRGIKDRITTSKEKT